MDAELVVDRLELLRDDAFQQLVVWLVPKPLRGSTHSYKYRLALVVGGVCVMRYDNEAGKGDHKHVGESQQAIDFVDLPALLSAFDADVDRWFDEHGSR
jgi:hypothetical protein